MWTKESKSPSPEFPKRVDLIRFLIERLVGKKVDSSWVHLELVKEAGLIKNLFSSQASFVEVACVGEDFGLNLGFQKNQLPEIPSHWQKNKKGLQKIPRSDLTALCNWIDSFFKNCSDLPDKNISDWIDGL